MEEAEIRAQIELDKVFLEASRSLVEEYRAEGISKVKKLIHATNTLRVEIKTAEIAVAKKKEQLTKKLGVLDQIRGGNWDLLSKIGKDDPDAGER